MYLLDTHVLVWAIGRPERLSRRVKTLIEARQAVVSVVSLWELIVKKERKDAPVGHPIKWWSTYITRPAMDVLPIRVAHLEQLDRLPGIHRDPFDRLLISQALSESIPLVTCDEEIAKYTVPVVWT